MVCSGDEFRSEEGGGKKAGQICEERTYVGPVDEVILIYRY